MPWAEGVGQERGARGPSLPPGASRSGCQWARFSLGTAGGGRWVLVATALRGVDAA